MTGRKEPPHPAAVLWKYIAGDGRAVGRFTVRSGWYRVDGGTLDEMRAARARQNGVVCRVTERGADGRCPKPDGVPE